MFTRLFSFSVSLSLSLMAATALSQNAYADKAKSPHKSGGITVQHYNDDGSLADLAPSQGNMNHHEMHRASSHAPIGVMGDHRHSKGEWMLSYRYMRMNMEGSRSGQSALNPQDIATTVPNRFFGTPMQPPTLRIVPLKMNMDMHMVGAMYGLGENDDGYSHGDIYEATSWAAYDLSRSFSVSLRGKLRTQAAISGLDTNILGPVQSADPDNYGGETADIAIGANYLFIKGALKHNRVGLELNLPVYRDLNGPQLETDSVLTLGWQRAF